MGRGSLSQFHRQIAHELDGGAVGDVRPRAHGRARQREAPHLPARAVGGALRGRGHGHRGPPRGDQQEEPGIAQGDGEKPRGERRHRAQEVAHVLRAEVAPAQPAG
eukprot:1259206-Pyramimonas_sp.AAC.1